MANMKQEERIIKAFNTLIGHCVDRIGFPKKPTATQIYNAQKAAIKFEKYLKAKCNETN